MSEKSDYFMRRAVRGAKRHFDRLDVKDYPNYDSDLRGFRRPEEAATREIARADIFARRNNLIGFASSIDALFGAYQILRGIRDRKVPEKYLDAIQMRLNRVVKRSEWLGSAFESYAYRARYFANEIIPVLKAA